MTSITAHFGENDLKKANGLERHINIGDVFIHDQYDEDIYDYDFALLRMRESLDLSSEAVKPICLLSDCESKPEDDRPTHCLTTGWSTIRNRKISPSKADGIEVTTVNVTAGVRCQQSLGSYDYTERKLCVQGYNNGGKPACQVDNGGPLFCKMANDDSYFLHGIASYPQSSCTRPGVHVVYSRPCFVGEWIQRIVYSFSNK